MFLVFSRALSVTADSRRFPAQSSVTEGVIQHCQAGQVTAAITS